ncbi:MAG TPA: ABC transporter permease [Candidatus Didemnitutus sp.]|nr:ABC transporter permease [Candidatus Didemnitutus sp.]
MIRFVIRRLLQLVPVVVVVVSATFFMLRAVPGGPFTQEKAVAPEVQRNLEAYYGLDQPLWKQYATYWSRLVRGDLGYSMKYSNRTVNEIVADKLPTSLELGAWALLVALGLGLPLGVLAAIRPNTWLDYLCTGIGLFGICVPPIVLGPVLSLVFGIGLHWFDVSGWDYADDRVLPAATLGLAYAAYIMRLTRGGMLEVLHLDYIRTARAKGAGEGRVVFRHALRGGLLPVVTYLGPAIAGILTGSFIIETLFQIPGLGREFIGSTTARDYPLIMGLVLLYTVFVVGMNLVADIVQVWMNPRLRFE